MHQLRRLASGWRCNREGFMMKPALAGAVATMAVCLAKQRRRHFVED